MTELLSILKKAKLEKSQDFYFLKKEGLRHIEELSHKLWTDYNIHDPGITILELLSYAITDLGYRTGFDIKDILTREINGLPEIQGNFHTALNIFPVNPVTFNDLRKLLIDIDGVHNAWISKNNEVVYCINTQDKVLNYCQNGDEVLPPLNGLFDALIEYEDYIEEHERINYFGLPERDNSATFINTSTRGIDFSVYHPITIRAVSVYAETAPGNVTVRLLKADETDAFIPEQEVTVPITVPDSKVEIALDFEILPDKKYRLDASGTDVRLARENTDGYPFEKQLLLSLNNGWGGASTNNVYYFFYDWKVTYSISPIERELSLSGQLFKNNLGLDPNSGSQAYIYPLDKGLVFDVLAPLTITAVSIIAETIGVVDIQIIDELANLLYSVSYTVNKINELSVVPMSAKLRPGKNYRLKAEGTTIRLQRTQNASFPVEIGNLIEIKQGYPSPDIYYFFYNIEVEYQYPIVQVASLTRIDVQKAVIERINHHRNLCEDYCSVRDLEFEHIAVCAELELTPDAVINEVLAEIFYQLELHVSPPVKFYSIKELQEKGHSTDQIFEGPVLDHGFIDDEEFRAIERRSEIHTSDVIQIIMDVPGVISVKNISLLSYVEAEEGYIVQPSDTTVIINGKLYLVKAEEWVLPLEDFGKTAPNFNPDFSKITFYKNDLPYFANKSKVHELFNEKRAKFNTGKLRGHQKDLIKPVGQDKNLESYYPVQNELPETYRVGNNRVQKSESNERKAQAKQLKAYLLFFEQILANYLSQLANVKELFSWNFESTVKTFFTQAVTDFSNIEEVYIFDENDHLNYLNSIIETTSVAEKRKNRFLDHLMARFAESFSEYAALMYSMYKNSASGELIIDKKLFLQEYPQISANRGKGFDYRFPGNLMNITGLAHRVSRLLGFENIERRNFASNRIEIEELVEGVPTEITGYYFVVKDEEGVILFESRPCKTRELICNLIDSTIGIGANEENWIFNEIDSVWDLTLVCFNDIELLGSTISADEAEKDDTMSLFIDLDKNEGLHVIENILLRPRSIGDQFLPLQIDETEENCECPQVKDPYSFRITVLLPSWPERFQFIRFRQFIEKTIRLETPAHIYPRICWINHCEMKMFEEHYNIWLLLHSEIAREFRGCQNLPNLEDPELELSTEQIDKLLAYREALQKLIDILNDLNNVFPLARLHSCQEYDEENPIITLNQTTLGTL